MDGAIFFFALGLSGLRCLGAWLGFHVAVGVRVCSTVPMLLARACSGSITLTAWAASSSHIGGSGDFFSFAFPPPSALLCLRVSISPPPAGSGDVRTGGRSAAAGGMAICLLLILSCRSLACARSLLSRLRFGFSFPRLALLPLFVVGSYSPASGPVLSCRPAFLPVLLIGWRGGLLCRGSLSSLAAVGGVPPLPVRWRCGCLVPAYCLPSICVSPRPSYRGAGRYFPFRLSFPFLLTRR